MCSTPFLPKIAGIEEESIVDGPGIRNVIFFQGCLKEPHCKHCQNPETWPMDAGEECNIDDLLHEWKQNPLLDGITFSGGDPFNFRFLEHDEFIKRCSAFIGYASVATKLYAGNLISFTGLSNDELFSCLDRIWGTNDVVKTSEVTKVTSAIHINYPDQIIDIPYVLYEFSSEYTETCSELLLWMQALSFSRYIISEPFLPECASIEALFRGSTNQRIMSGLLTEETFTTPAIANGSMRFRLFDLTDLWDLKDEYTNIGIHECELFLRSHMPIKFTSYSSLFPIGEEQ